MHRIKGDIANVTFQERVKKPVWDKENPDFSIFKDVTRRLLIELWEAPERFLSKEDIREDVIGDVEASDGAVWSVILRARKAIEGSGMGIENIRGKGYRLQPLLPFDKN
jgi:DNA-binding response OmpR family regulator